MGTNETTDIHASYLHWVEEASAYRLAELAGCGAPDSKLSPGAEILGEVRDAVIQRWRAGRFDYDTDRNDHDVAMECAEEGIIPEYDHEIVALFADLAAWQEGNEFTEKGEWSGSFIDMFKDAISQITERAAFAFVREVRDDFDRNFQCPECGDEGTPHVCYPGDCRGSDEEKATYAASLAASAEAILTGPVDLPADPFRGHPDYAGEDWQRDHGVTAEPVTEPVRDPLLDIIDAHERQARQLPGDETAAFMTRMEAINAAEFARVRRFRWALVACVTVALVVAWIIL